MVRGQWANLAKFAGLHPYSFSKNILRFFFMTTESQDLGLTSHLKDGAFPFMGTRTASPRGRYGERLQRDSCLKIHM